MSEPMTVRVKCDYCELEPDPNCEICGGLGYFQATREEIDREYPQGRKVGKVGK